MNTNSIISYEGHVKISVVGPNNKVLFSSESHNKGKEPLFKFLGYCLTGAYYDELRPCRIRLFTVVDPETDTPANPDFSKETCRSAAILHEPGMLLESTGDSCSATYHFKIPYAFITLKEGGSKQIIYKLALYCDTNSSESKISDISAEYLFIDSSTNQWAESDDAIDLSDLKSNYSLVIDWTMTLQDISKV